MAKNLIWKLREIRLDFELWFRHKTDSGVSAALYADLPKELVYWYADKPHQVLRRMMMRLDEVDPSFRKEYTPTKES